MHVYFSKFVLRAIVLCVLNGWRIGYGEINEKKECEIGQ